MELSEHDRLAKHLPQKLALTRMQRDLGINELAAEAKIGHATLERWESGKTRPQREPFARVLKVLAKHPIVNPDPRPKPGHSRIVMVTGVDLRNVSERDIIAELKRRGYSVTLTM